MSIVQRILGAYSVVMAAVVGVLFFLTPVYDDGSTGYPTWVVVNWFMAPAVLTAYMVRPACALVRKHDGQA